MAPRRGHQPVRLVEGGVGFGRVPLHDLRHFVANVLGDAGVPMVTISGRLGRGDTATTLNLSTRAWLRRLEVWKPWT